MSKKRVFKIFLGSAVFLLAVVCISFAKSDHREYRDAKRDDCRDCHLGSGVMENHGAFFRTNHKLLARKAGSNCGDCHQQSYCLDCHNGGNIDTDMRKSLSWRGETMPKTHRSDFISIHPVKAADNPQTCYRCHESKFCEDCHTNRISLDRARMSIKPHSPNFIAPGVPDPSWVSRHRADGRRSLQTCQGCHPQKADCTNFACHPNLQGR